MVAVPRLTSLEKLATVEMVRSGWIISFSLQITSLLAEPLEVETAANQVLEELVCSVSQREALYLQ